ncbi:uncharacterized protein LOC122402431 [Colletes gigas]|uniref:uncharacterized protein LOC122402431 n=1 Tax=Colletes gigas TaxID=935657 RepID=UPI001C9BBA2E|nr:uncharacterized protein LOC122402431 [Colletes gigas]
MIRERRRQQASDPEDAELSRDRGEDRSRNWIDLDENVLDGYILIDDACLEPTVVPDESQELPYPEGAEELDDDEDDGDADSHGNDEIYGRIGQAVAGKLREEVDFSMTYPIANSHGNANQASSHSRYSELYSELAIRNYLDANRDDTMNYSVANSHGDHSASSGNRERSIRENTETDQLNWDSRQHSNYEVANSHSNYRVYYDSQTQQREFLQTSGWPVESWKGHLLGSAEVANDKKQKSANLGNVDATRIGESEAKSESGHCSESGCDIEQCLVQIEESLMNIEQNLLHVQNLDIPELRNLLYKSPSIEKSLSEVQDLLYADGIVPAKKRKPLTVDSEEENEEDEDEEEEEEEEEEVWVDRDLPIKDNDDEDDDAGAGAFDASNEESSDTANAEENNRSGSADDRSKVDYANGSTIFREESNSNYMNFIPNSLNKTLPRRVFLEGTKENIRLCSSGPEEPTIIDYNLNTTCAEKKLFCRDKCHSRTNSLDENSAFPNFDKHDKHETGKSSLQNLLFETVNSNSLDLSVKARSEEMLRTPRERFSKALNKRGIDEKQWTIMEARTKDFRRKIESITSHRRFTVSDANDQKRSKASKELLSDNATHPREKSPARPRRGLISGDRNQDKESGDGKGFEKRKRKKISSRGQSSSENALVPSKLISLSLSILLAALLQAVRCLTNLVEDAFRSVSYDRNGLLQ